MKKLKLSTKVSVQNTRDALLHLNNYHILKFNDRVYKLNGNEEDIELLSCSYSEFDNCWVVDLIDFRQILNNCSTNVYELVEMEWYENIPDNGILCQVNIDSDSDRRDMFSVIVGWDRTNKAFPFINNADRVFRDAKPVSLDYMKKYFL